MSSIYRITVMCLIFCTVPVLATGIYDNTNNPNVDGSAEYPFEIATAAQLNELGLHSEDWDKHFVLTADIDLSAYSGTSFNIIGSSLTPFSGVFDGNDHAILDFTFKPLYAGTYSYTGIFGCLDGDHAEIKKITVASPYVDGKSGDYIGALVGYLKSGQINNCHVIGGIVIGDQYIGGLVGNNFRGAILDSSSTGSVFGTKDIGGLVGSNADYITRSYAKSHVTASTTTGGCGGLAGINYRVISNCYAADNDVSEGYYTGGLVGRNLGYIFDSYARNDVTNNASSYKYCGGLVGMNSYGTILNCYVAGSAYIYGFGGVGCVTGSNTGTVTNCFWDSQLCPRTGDGAKSTAEMKDPNTFLNAGWDFIWEEENGISDIWASASSNNYMVLYWQIDEANLPSLPSFSGGNGSTASPFIIADYNDLNSISDNPRLMISHFELGSDINIEVNDFGSIGSIANQFMGVFDGNNHSISNYRIEHANSVYTGLFEALYGTNSKIENLTLVSPYISTSAGAAGPIAGIVNEGTIANCSVQNAFVSSNSAGGLVAENRGGTITSCYSTSYIVAGRCGGMVCTNRSGTIHSCSAQVTISATSTSGGVVGYNQTGQVINCSAIVDIQATGDKIGGIVGYNNAGTISYCGSRGSLHGNYYVGGIIGRNYGTLMYSFSTAQVSGYHGVGGAVGQNNNDGLISNCYAQGPVSANYYCGGLVGENYEAIYKSYSTGHITAGSMKGGLVGSSAWDSICQNSFCDKQTSGITTAGAGTPLTTAEMQTLTTYTNSVWDFVDESANGTSDFWIICQQLNYPRFTWQVPPADFVCPDGVALEDFAYLAAYYLADTPGPNEPPDLTGDAFIDMGDLVVLTDNWLSGKY